MGLFLYTLVYYYVLQYIGVFLIIIYSFVLTQLHAVAEKPSFDMLQNFI